MGGCPKLYISQRWSSPNALISGYSGQKRAASAQLANRHAGCKSGNRRANPQVRKSQSLGEVSVPTLDNIPSVVISATRFKSTRRGVSRLRRV